MCGGRRGELRAATQSVHLPDRYFIVWGRGMLLDDLVFVSYLRGELDKTGRAGV